MVLSVLPPLAGAPSAFGCCRVRGMFPWDQVPAVSGERGRQQEGAALSSCLPIPGPQTVPPNPWS